MSFVLQINGYINNQGELKSNLPRTENFTGMQVGLQRIHGFAYNTNIDSDNNKIWYKKTTDSTWKELTLPNMRVDYDSLNTAILSLLPDADKIDVTTAGVTTKVSPFTFTVNANQFLVQMKLYNGWEIDFTRTNTLRDIIGFNSRVVTNSGSSSIIVNADYTGNILKYKTINVKCNITDGGYDSVSNSTESGASLATGTIFSMANTFPPSTEILFTPNPILFFPCKEYSFNNVTISFRNEYDKPVTFNSNFNVTVVVQKIS